MSYHIYLSYNNNEEVIELPVLPKKIEISGSGNNKSAEVIDLGEVTQLKLPKLFSMQIDSEFPSEWYPACNVSERKLKDPYDYIAKIEKWRKTYNYEAFNNAIKDLLDDKGINIKNRRNSYLNSLNSIRMNYRKV